MTATAAIVVLTPAKNLNKVFFLGGGEGGGSSGLPHV